MGTVQVKALESGQVALDEAVVAGFRASLRGELIGRGDAAYDQARAIYNAMIDKRPALIARCAAIPRTWVSANDVPAWTSVGAPYVLSPVSVTVPLSCSRTGVPCTSASIVASTP